MDHEDSLLGYCTRDTEALLSSTEHGFLEAQAVLTNETAFWCSVQQCNTQARGIAGLIFVHLLIMGLSYVVNTVAYIFGPIFLPFLPLYVVFFFLLSNTLWFQLTRFII